MAVVNETILAPQFANDWIHIITWSGLTFSGLDSGRPIQMAGSSDRSVQFTGTFGTGGSVLFEGSNDGTNYFTLTDPQGNTIVKTAAGGEQVIELTRYVRPRVTAGDGTTSITCSLLLKRVK
jgi:hypothetical protein